MASLVLRAAGAASGLCINTLFHGGVNPGVESVTAISRRAKNTGATLLRLHRLACCLVVDVSATERKRIVRLHLTVGDTPAVSAGTGTRLLLGISVKGRQVVACFCVGRVG